MAIAAGAGAEPDRFQLRLEIDSAGEVVAAEPLGEMPPAVLEALRLRARAWRFETPRRAEVALPGRTYAHVAVCQIAGEGGASIYARVLGTGPGTEGRQPLRYPTDALREGHSGEFDFEYEVAADGRMRLRSLERTSGVGSTSFFRAAIRNWLRSRQFHPEMVDGVPVATRVRSSVRFSADGNTYRSVEEMRAAAEARRVANAGQPTCEQALEQASQASRTESDSPYKLILGD
jgi:hypothetical protein